MNAFMHLILPRRNTNVKITQEDKTLRIEINDGLTDRVVVEVAHVGTVVVKGLQRNE